MKLLFPLCFLLFAVSSLYGQQKDSLDVIHLRNGMIMEGLIVDLQEDKFLKLELAGGVRMSIQLSDINEIDWAGGSNGTQRVRKTVIDPQHSLQLKVEEGRLVVPLVETVYLTNGEKVIGKIMDYQKGKSLKIVDLAGIEMVLQEEQIARIVQEAHQPTLKRYLRQRRQMLKPVNYAFKEKGIFYSMSLSTFSSTNDVEEQNETAVGFHFVVGRQWQRLLGTGIGIGVDGYDSFSSGATLIPLYLQARGYFRKKWQSPFYSINAGYAFAAGGDTVDFEVDANGGYLFHPALGWRFSATERANFIMDLGLKFQKAYIKRVATLNGDLETRNILYQRFTLRIGLVF